MQFWIRIIEVLYLPFPSGHTMNFIKIEVSNSFPNEVFSQVNQIVLRKPQVVKRRIKRFISCGINFSDTL